MIEAIQTRYSCRQFVPRMLEKEHEAKIAKFLSEINVPFNHKVSITYHSVPNDKRIVYFEGPKQFVALSTAQSPVDQAKLGFLGELFILYCESLGVSTCWMGHFNRQDVNHIIQDTSKQGVDDHLYCIILLGYPSEKTNILSRFSKKFMSKKSRTAKSFLHEDSMTEFPSYIETSLEMASRAPSAMNSQKWYYYVKEVDRGYSIELSKPKGYQHFKWKNYDIDVGTAASHLWLGLISQGKETKTSISDNHGNAVWTFYCE